jgi:hypothetical protein
MKSPVYVNENVKKIERWPFYKIVQKAEKKHINRD